MATRPYQIPTTLLDTMNTRNGPSTNCLFPEPIDAECQLIAIIPARDEEDSLEPSLSALARQTDLTGQPIDPRRYEVLLLINNSTDWSVQRARQVARKYPSLRLHIAEIELPEDRAHVGHARRLLMDSAWLRFQRIGHAGGIIASTDADSVVSPNWVAATIQEIQWGADAVGGRILISPDDLRTMDPAARICHLRDVGYRALIAEIESLLAPVPGDPWPRHFQHFGPSIAVTASTYERAGGLPVLASLEDVALHDELERIGATIRHSPDVRVYTSARPKGRTGFGFAKQLQIWAEMYRKGDPVLVRSAEDIIDELATRRVSGRVRGMNREDRLKRFPLVEITRATQDLRLYRSKLLLNGQDTFDQSRWSTSSR